MGEALCAGASLDRSERARTELVPVDVALGLGMAGAVASRGAVQVPHPLGVDRQHCTPPRDQPGPHGARRPVAYTLVEGVSVFSVIA